MSEIKFYILDVETTGTKANYHEMTEVGIIRCSDRVSIFEKIKCLFPSRASLDALRITNKTFNDLKEGLSQQEVINRCNYFLNDDNLTPKHRCIVGHNVQFDRKFLHHMWKSNNKQFPADLWLDTMALTRAYAKKIGLIKPKVNLHASCDLVGIKKLSTAHNAKVDCRNTYFLHKNLIEEKQIDYLDFIKNIPHIISEEDDSSYEFENYE